MIGADTNVILRYFLWDDPVHSAVASRFIDADCSPERPAVVNMIVLAEATSYLEQKRRAKKNDVVDFLDMLFQNPNIRIDVEDIVISAIELFNTGKAGFADCLIFALNQQRGIGKTTTFDKSAAANNMMTLLT
jgi:predicted nucleic-acid-binding protein